MFKLYGIIYSFDIRALIKAIVDKILGIKLLLVIYINLKLLYEYFIKLKII
jgi:hypothetical protein